MEIDANQSRFASKQQKGSMRKRKAKRGFAAMSPALQLRIATLGALTVSSNRRHMAEIGRIGGTHSHDRNKPERRAQKRTVGMYNVT